VAIHNLGPAIGLATYVARPRRLTDECFIAAAQASTNQVGLELRAKGMLFPSQANILKTEVTTATRVAEFMFDQGLARSCWLGQGGRSAH
jgi:malate dehydrogenase (oxaloacetate-decarboxylating)(NADP+)